MWATPLCICYALNIAIRNGWIWIPAIFLGSIFCRCCPCYHHISMNLAFGKWVFCLAAMTITKLAFGWQSWMLQITFKHSSLMQSPHEHYQNLYIPFSSIYYQSRKWPFTKPSPCSCLFYFIKCSKILP